MFCGECHSYVGYQWLSSWLGVLSRAFVSTNLPRPTDIQEIGKQRALRRWLSYATATVDRIYPYWQSLICTADIIPCYRRELKLCIDEWRMELMCKICSSLSGLWHFRQCITYYNSSVGRNETWSFRCCQLTKNLFTLDWCKYVYIYLHNISYIDSFCRYALRVLRIMFGKDTEMERACSSWQAYVSDCLCVVCSRFYNNWYSGRALVDAACDNFDEQVIIRLQATLPTPWFAAHRSDVLFLKRTK